MGTLFFHAVAKTRCRRAYFFAVLPCVLLTLLLLVFAGQGSAASTSTTSAPPLDLSEAEKAWLQAHPVLRVGVDTEWMPLEGISSSGRHVGILADYLGWLASQLNLTLTPETFPDRIAFMKAAVENEVDLVSSVAQRTVGESNLLFTRPILSVPMVLITRADYPFIAGLQSLTDKKVAVVGNYLGAQILSKEFPDITAAPVPSTEDGINALMDGKADALFAHLDVATAVAHRMGVTGLKVAAITPYAMQVRFGIRSDWPELVDIFNKALATLSPDQIKEFQDRWADTQLERRANWEPFWRMALVGLLVMASVILVSVRANKKLRREMNERKKAEMTLSAILENLPGAVCMRDRQNTLIYVNAACCVMLDKPMERIVGRPFREGASRLQYERILEKGEVVKTTGKPATVEHAVMTPGADGGGEVRYFSTTQVPVRDAQGEICATMGLTTDITSVKNLERQVFRQLGTLQNLLATSPIGVVISIDGIINYVNPYATKVLGTKLGDSAVLVHPSPADRVRVLQTLETQDVVYDVELTIRNATGECHYLLGTYSKAEYDGRPAVIAWLVDVSARKSMENELRRAKDAAEDASRTKSDFLANMSHEIRTPMNAILGMSYLTMQTELTPKQRNYVSSIDVSAKALLRIINDILDFSKIEAGKMEMEVTAFSLSEVLEKAMEVVSVQAEAKRIELLLRVSKSVPQRMEGDPLRLTQVIQNLLANAVKFTENGEISLSVAVVRQDDRRATLRFSVRDTGIGIAPERLDKIFDSFTQADTSTTRRHGGTGLGLAICKRLVEMMHGRISVESSPDKGSIFSFTAEFDVPEQPSRPQRSAAVRLQGLRVLIVDDNAMARLVLRELFADITQHITLAASGEAALSAVEQAAAQHKPYQLILLDWKMPGMDGTETARRLREMALPESATVIMVTAHNKGDALRETEGSGIAEVLVKPVNPSSLYDIVARIVHMPEEEENAAEPEEITAPEAEGFASLEGARILLVEDNAINQCVAMEILQAFGAQVDIALDGVEAVEKVPAGQYQLVLMDIQMPRMDGLEATRRLRQNSDLAHVPIVAMTAHAMAGDKEKSLRAGMQDHVTKPFDPKELHAVLSRWLVPGAL